MEALLIGDERPAPNGGGKCLTQSLYEALGNSKKVLVTLCLGLKNANGAALINIDESPWSLEPKGNVKPTNKELVMEVKRRQKLFLQTVGNNKSKLKSLAMKPNNKSREVLIEWLDEWPIKDPACVEFLVAEANRVRDLLQVAIEESRETAVAIQHGAWSGPIPYLRLIHCMSKPS